MNKDARGMVKMKFSLIIANMVGDFVIFSGAAIIAAHNVGIVLIVSLAMFGSWQMGTLTERNDWDKWYREKHE